ncbi:unnamed protein product [Aphanomyces euteiches]|uniref:Uncharacterized protein n=1 Tax=Aphanomyces euteiches TaxID=100861 RepID=A0A6G0XCE2_9STRA|nr:hypothetical protein Ae201684_006244 [Aphanomyces euteiches]KAH9069109.1 hypothetical protein Ae201684P_004803 [Aphanomyces euteiches]KAH9150975.1 hypothetical protein AeRB84_006303 [Aphanomyces euteiches]
MYDLLSQGKNQFSLTMLSDDDGVDNADGEDDDNTDAMDQAVEVASVLDKLNATVAKCVHAGLQNAAANTLRKLLHELRDTFRLLMRARHGPVVVLALVVTLKPSAKPFNWKMRPYAPTYQEYLS